MKKKLSILSLVTALIVLLFTGCSTGSKNAEGSKQEQPSQGQAPNQVEQSKELEKELIIAGNGATVEQLMKDEIFKLFNEKYPNVKLTYVSGVSTELVAKIKAQKGAPQIDVAIIEGGEQENGRVEGLWETITANEIPNIAKVGVGLEVNENSGVTVNFTPMGISYNTEIVQEKGLPIPESWNDLARPEMKGYITMTEITSNFGRSTTIMLAYANGGSEENIDPGFEKLKTIAGYMPTFAKSAAQLTQNLQDKSAAYTTWTMARSIVQKQENGLPLEFVIPKEGANVVPNVAVVVKNAPHPNAAHEFINFLLSEEVQTLYATKLYYNPAIDVSLPEEVKQLLDFDQSKIVKFDYEVLSNNSKVWLDRFNKEIAPLVGK